MERERTQRLLAISMLVLGTLQVGLGVLSDNFPFAAFGFIYKLVPDSSAIGVTASEHSADAGQDGRQSRDPAEFKQADL